MSLSSNVNLIKAIVGEALSESAWVQIFLLAFSTISFLLSAKAVFVNLRIYQRTKKRWDRV